MEGGTVRRKRERKGEGGGVKGRMKEEREAKKRCEYITQRHQCLVAVVLMCSGSEHLMNR